jgi:hypothetical protein
MFEVLLGAAILWLVWLITMIIGVDYEDAYRRTVQNKIRGNKSTK